MNNKKIKPTYDEVYSSYIIASQERYKYKNVIDKIKEIANKTDYDKWELQMTSIEKLMKIQKILEEVDE